MKGTHNIWLDIRQYNYSSVDPHNRKVMSNVIGEVLSHPDNKYEEKTVKR